MSKINIINKKTPLWISEEIIKDNVYQTFENKRVSAKATVDSSASYVNSGHYEEQATFMSYNALAKSRQDWHRTEDLIGRLYSKPYFSHIAALLNGENKDYFLSDNENLDGLMFIGDNGCLLPFKQDPERPFLSQIFHCYQARNGEVFTDKEGNIIKPTLICDDEIFNGELLNVTLIYSEHKEQHLSIDADELLAQKLQENRENPVLTNIISTLQLSQFEIIQDDVHADFAVQGCAGSGKSQILLHRLFFLRDMLSETNWEKVLLITPSELFRSYSSELVKRYGLSSIKNTSIAELYKSFLEAFDGNFKNRQYRFELTEEYLPDEYLQEIYADSTIQRIDIEIERAIKEYISDACELIGTSLPEEYDSKYVNELVNALELKINEIDAIETQKNKCPEDIDNEASREKYTSQIEELKTVIKKLEEEYNSAIEQTRAFDEAYGSYLEIKKERSEWTIQRQIRISNINKKLANYEKTRLSKLNYDIPGKYALSLFEYNDLTNGDTFIHDEEYLKFLNEYYKQAKSDVLKFCQGEKPELHERNIREQITSIHIKLNEYKDNLRDINSEYERFELKQTEFKKRQNQDVTELKALRSKLVRSRFFLQRLETIVFEKEVWNTLTPLKEKYDVKLFESTNGGKRDKLLYKSDLLFYLRIYTRLHPSSVLPDYNLICIDEGQDLHHVEYSTLRYLYPNANFNVFGDIAQVLHTNCGIHSWQTDTSVKKVYGLNKNYRNTAAIVEFCNRKFNSMMEYLGTPSTDSQPRIISEITELSKLVNSTDATIIVRNKKMFNQFCTELNIPESAFEFLDTNASAATTNRTKCYTIYAAKGLEFSKAIVYSKGMTKNQQVVACTRAMESLYYYE